ncbi:hypothetical protein [Rhodococcus sp. KBS0724]|nr:hypothetical protein [Rhodococcus sp. KBS0724]
MIAAAELLILGLRISLHVIGLAVTVLVVGSAVDWAAGVLIGDID